jgi:hypothetical protein
MSAMLNAYRQETCTHIAVTRPGSFNEITETPTTENCKIVFDRKYIKNDKGEDMISDTQVYLRKDITITNDDMIQFTDSKVKFPIKKIVKPRAFIVAYGHTEVFL